MIEPDGSPPSEPDVATDAEMFRLLVQSVRDYAIFMLDPAGNVVTWNDGASRIKGYSESEIVGRHFSTFYPEAEVRAGKPDWELIVAADIGRFEDEGWRLRKDGSRFWANVVITALRDEQGVLRGYGKVTRDLTARREAELERIDRERHEAEKARQHAARLGDLERAKTEFLNLASHELRGPLAVARGYVSMLTDGSLSPQQFAELAPIIEGKLVQMEGMVHKMLETARLEYEQLQLASQRIDLTALVMNEVTASRATLGPDHRILMDLNEEPPVTVVADRERIRSVVVNLIDNAIKYSPVGGTIDVKVASRRGHAFVSVADEGIGVDGEDVDRIFDRFVRLERPETLNVAGTGLGLYLAREVARRHGGDIMVESTPGRGSRFTLSLPIDEGKSKRRG